MACFHCRIVGHNIQTCPSVRRCRNCRGHGHDRRNCPGLARSPMPPPPSLATIECRSMRQLLQLCSQNQDCLVHMYWPNREEHFRENIPRLKTLSHWLLVATPGHGAQKTERPTLNFLLPDNVFVQGYPSASRERGFRHGVLFRRTAIEQFDRQTGYDFAEVCVNHPNAFKESERAEGWRYDIGSRRPKALHDLSYGTVARLATPEGQSQHIRIPAEFVVAWWALPNR